MLVSLLAQIRIAFGIFSVFVLDVDVLICFVSFSVFGAFLVQSYRLEGNVFDFA